MECIGDSGCPPGEVCVNNQCVKDNGGNLDIDLGDLGISWVTKLKTLANNPASALLGVFLDIIIGGFLRVWKVVIGGALFLLFGGKYAPDLATMSISQEIGNLEGQIGLVDVPIVVIQAIFTPFDTLGSMLLGYLAGAFDWIEAVFATFGIFALPAELITGTLIVVGLFRLWEAAGWSIVESIPVIGPFLDNLFGGDA